MKKLLMIITVLLFATTISSYANNLRIISLAPNISELLVAMGGGDLLISTPDSNYKNDLLSRMKKSGQYTLPDYKDIRSLSPDLIITSHWDASIRENLAPIPVLLIQTSSLKSLPSIITKLGVIIGRPERAEKIADHVREELDSIKATYNNKEVVKVAFIVHADASNPDSSFVAGKETYIDDAITLCHGDNVFSDQSGYFVSTINNTELLSADLMVDASINPIKKRPKNMTYVHMNPDDILRYSQSMLPGLKQLCASIDDKRKEKYNN